MSLWYAVETKSRCEGLARENLQRQGFAVYLPQYLKRRSHARRVEMVKAPLFPGYLFVSLGPDASWRPIRSTVGVLRLVCWGDRPIPLPKGIIEDIRRRESKGVVDLNECPAFQAGDRIRVATGPLEERVGLFQCVDDRQRVVLLLEIMGREVAVRVPVGSVEAA